MQRQATGQFERKVRERCRELNVRCYDEGECVSMYSPAGTVFNVTECHTCISQWEGGLTGARRWIAAWADIKHGLDQCECADCLHELAANGGSKEIR